MTWALFLLLVLNDGNPTTTMLSRHETRTACALAAHNERRKPWPDRATVRVLYCREVKGGA